MNEEECWRVGVITSSQLLMVLCLIALSLEICLFWQCLRILAPLNFSLKTSLFCASYFMSENVVACINFFYTVYKCITIII